VSEQTSRARQALLHKRLRDKDRQMSDKESELQQLRGQLDAKDRIVQELTENVNELRLRLTASESYILHQSVDLDTAHQTQVVSCGHICISTQNSVYMS